MSDRPSSRWRNFFTLMRQTAQEFGQDKVPRLGAALAYYTIFSLAPLLIIAIAIAGLVFGDDAARGRVSDQIATLINPDAAEAIEELIVNSSKPTAGMVASIIGVVTLLLGASGVVGQLKDAMNTIWGVKPLPGRGFIRLLRDRFLSLAMVLGIGFLLLVSLLLSAAIDAAQNFALGEAVGVASQAINFVVTLFVVTGLFAVIYKVLPDVEIAWRDVWVGAIVTALLFNVGKLLIGVYLSRSSTASSFGAAGSLIVVLVWVYYSTQILFFGAEFTQVFANRFGSKLVPAEGMTLLDPAQRAAEGISKQETPSVVPVPDRVRRATPLAVVLLVIYDLARDAFQSWRRTQSNDGQAAPIEGKSRTRRT